MTTTSLSGQVALVSLPLARHRDDTPHGLLSLLEARGVGLEAQEGELVEHLADAAVDSPWFRSLNGNWKFNWVKQPVERPVSFLSKCPRASGSNAMLIRGSR